MKLNKTQKLICEISGYSPLETSARNDAFYSCGSNSSKQVFLTEFVGHAEGFEPYSISEICEAHSFLITEFNNENDRYHAFNEAGMNKKQGTN